MDQRVVIRHADRAHREIAKLLDVRLAAPPRTRLQQLATAGATCILGAPGLLEKVPEYCEEVDLNARPNPATGTAALTALIALAKLP